MTIVMGGIYPAMYLDVVAAAAAAAAVRGLDLHNLPLPMKMMTMIRQAGPEHLLQNACLHAYSCMQSLKMTQFGQTALQAAAARRAGLK